MIALRNALSRSAGLFNVPQGSAFTQRAIYTIFRRIYTEVNAPLGKSLLGRTSINFSRSLSSGMRPLQYKGPPFPDGETMKEFISEHPQLNTPEFQKNRLNNAIATLCADRLALRTVSDDLIPSYVSKIYNNLLNGRDSVTGEEIQQYHLTNNMCVTLDKILPAILKECARKHHPVDKIDLYRVSGS